MLETEEIDDDYFTPASSTSLANIFGKARKRDGTENESLKYTPPKSTKSDEQKATQCVFACALMGYQWKDGAYMACGKLGFAILKMINGGIHNFVLYDSDKTTLSCATLSSTFDVTLKENVYFSYHDNQQKYWSLYASENDLKKIVDICKSLDISVKYSSVEDKEQPQPLNETIDSTIKHAVNEEQESDTDSSINRRTKMSILNRMASMGQSVLPPRAVPAERTSDSSDTSDTNNYKTVRHKPVKSVIKRNSSDKNLLECQSLMESSPQNIENSSNSVPLFTYFNGQLVPVTNSNIFSCSPSGSDMNYFISEQRVSNSEMRINMNRLTDKVDLILGKLTVVEGKDKSNTTNNFQFEILQKLLTEYENKIKMYEDFIRVKKVNDSTPLISHIPKEGAKNIEDDLCEKIKYLEQINKSKDDKIAQLENDCKLLSDKFHTAVSEEKKNHEILTDEISRLKQELNSKNEALNESNRKFKLNETPSISEADNNVGDKIKYIMNDTYRAISANFENNEEYSGGSVKVITASIIKKVTIEALNDLQ